METYPDSSIEIFNSPARIIIAGYSNSGKTQACTKLMQMYHNRFHSILYCGVDNHPLQDHDGISEKLTVSSEILNPFEYVIEETCEGILYVLDDCFLEAVENKHVVDAFTKGRHKKISTIFITQNMFFSGKYARNISLNCSHYILMKNRDMGQIETLGRQLYGRGKSRDFVEIYKRALSVNTFGYLLVDLAADTPESLQLRTNILNETSYQIIYQW